MGDASSLAARPALAMLASIGQRPAGVVARECLGRQVAIIHARKAGETQLAEQFRAEFGLNPPDGPRSVSSSKIVLLGLGPSRWLAVATSAETGIAEALERAVAGCGSLIDQTDGLALLCVSGARTRDMFAKGLPIDLHDSSFAVGDVAVSTIDHISVTIWRLDDTPTFEVAIPRSYAAPFAHWLQESAAEFGLEIVRN
jgi:sarcosine oxidase subunit gamma